MVWQLFVAHNMHVSLYQNKRGAQHTHNKKTQPSQPAYTTCAQPSYHGLLLIVIIVIVAIAANILAQQQQWRWRWRRQEGKG
jgi:hypothetical protein